MVNLAFQERRKSLNLKFNIHHIYRGASLSPPSKMLNGFSKLNRAIHNPPQLTTLTLLKSLEQLANRNRLPFDSAE